MTFLLLQGQMQFFWSLLQLALSSRIQAFYLENLKLDPTYMQPLEDPDSATETPVHTKNKPNLDCQKYSCTIYLVGILTRFSHQ